MSELVVYAVVLVVLAVPLGAYMAWVYRAPLARWERKLFGEREHTWRDYAVALMVLNVVGIVVVYAMQRLQAFLPWNPNALPAVDARVAFNTAVSFGTNTNWQAYAGETTMSHFTQSAALGVQNFVSAACGMAVLVALVRGFTRRHADTIGNFWVDLTRSTVFILLPLSVILAIALAHQGVPQTLAGHEQHAGQVITVGPVASQVAIKQLGTNGGGFYNANSAHPLENPTPLTNFLECIAILLIPTALCFTFGRLVGSRKQGVALLLVMALLVVPFLALTTWAETRGNPVLSSLAIDQHLGNMEGKEVRFGAPASALWATVTTAASNGSVNSMHDSFTPLGGLGPLVLMQLGEVAFGGVGSGLYGLVIFAIVAVFIAGLMVGRTPEFLGKKIEAYEMKMASLAILVPVAAVLIGAGCACLVDETAKSLGNPGAHGFSEVLYAFSSMGNNNGSAFGGLTASGTFWATVGGIAMWIARYWIIIPTLAIAGSLARKKSVPPSAGTLPTAGPLFIVLLVGVVLLVGALSFVPSLALGPIAEHLGG